MFQRTLLSTAIISGSVIAALNSRAPVGVGPQARTEIHISAANLPEPQIVDYTFVFIEGETDASGCLPSSPASLADVQQQPSKNEI